MLKKKKTNKKIKKDIILQPMKKTNKHINISLSLPFEQNVNVSYFYINLTDLNFYKFSNVKTI
jgi:uncharacterized protein YwqG